MMLQHFESVASGVREALANAAPGQPTARKRFALETARLGARLFTPEQRVAWCGVLAPFDLLNALDVSSCFVEFVGAILAGTGNVEPLLETAEREGYATDTCSYHRAVTGATLAGLMPDPDFLVATSAPCTGGLAVIEGLARHFGRELLVLHIPADDSDASVAYLAEQLEAMCGFVERHTGRGLDPQRLRRAVELTNEARALMVEAYQLSRAVPSPARTRDLINMGVVLSLFLGTPAAVDIARTYRDEYAAKLESGQLGPERVRLMWLQNRIQFRHPLLDLLPEHDAAVVVDELNDITWDPIDPDDPFPGMARRIMSIPLCGPVSRRVRSLQRLAQEARIDGAINPTHWGCRQGTGARGLLEDGLREVGVPVLNLEVDCVDPRQFAEGQLRTRLEAFLEVLG